MRCCARTVQAGAEEHFPFTPGRKATALGGKEEVFGAEQLLAEPQLAVGSGAAAESSSAVVPEAPGPLQLCPWGLSASPLAGGAAAWAIWFCAGVEVGELLILKRLAASAAVSGTVSGAES